MFNTILVCQIQFSFIVAIILNEVEELKLVFNSNFTTLMFVNFFFKEMKRFN